MRARPGLELTDFLTDRVTEGWLDFTYASHRFTVNDQFGQPLSRLRKLCLALPEAHEVEAWGEPTFRVRNKLFAMHADAHNHHGLF